MGRTSERAWRTTALALGAMAAVAMVVATGCAGGGSDDGEGAGSAVGEVVGGEPSDGDGGAAAAGTLEVGETASVALDDVVHFQGLIFHLEGAELAAAAPSDGGTDPAMTVTVDLEVENPAGGDASPDPSLIHLEQDGATVGDPAGGDVPQVPSGARSAWEMVVDDVPTDTVLDQVELVFGGQDLHQARVPFDETGESVTLEPVEISPGESRRGELSEIDIAVTGGRLLYGDPEHHRALPADVALLVVELTVTTTADSRSSGGVAVTGSDLRVNLPDGTSVGAEPGGVTDFGNVLGPSETTTGTAGFEVPAELQGDIEVMLRGNYGAEGYFGDVVESAAAVTVPEQ